MYSFIITILVGIIIGAVTTRDLGSVWGIVCMFGAMLISQLVIGLIIRRKVAAKQQGLEAIMREAQAKLNRQLQLFQQRPPSNVNLAQQQLEKLQFDAIRKTLAATDCFLPYYRWNVMLKKQINTMKMQLYYQLKEFGKVDELLPKSFLMDARSLQIKLVRLYKHNDPQLDKFYQKKCRRLKGDDGALTACTYAWIKLKQDQPEAATAALIAAQKLSGNAVLAANYENLVNRRYKHFNNSGFGDLWYSLYLEEPKVKQQRAQQRMY